MSALIGDSVRQQSGTERFTFGSLIQKDERSRCKDCTDIGRNSDELTEQPLDLKRFCVTSVSGLSIKVAGALAWCANYVEQCRREREESKVREQK